MTWTRQTIHDQNGFGIQGISSPHQNPVCALQRQIYLSGTCKQTYIPRSYFDSISTQPNSKSRLRFVIISVVHRIELRTANKRTPPDKVMWHERHTDRQ